MNIRHDLVSVYVIRQSESGHEILQLHRSPGQFMGSTWQNISGSIETGEKAWEAAIRELKEETGLVPTQLYVLEAIAPFYVHSMDTLFHCVQFCAIVDGDSSVILDHESDGFRWLDLSTAAGEFMWPGERSAIEMIKSEILDNSISKPYLQVPIR